MSVLQFDLFHLTLWALTSGIFCFASYVTFNYFMFPLFTPLNTSTISIKISRSLRCTQTKNPNAIKIERTFTPQTTSCPLLIMCNVSVSEIYSLAHFNSSTLEEIVHYRCAVLKRPIRKFIFFHLKI